MNILKFFGFSVNEDEDSFSNDFDRPWYTNFGSPLISAMIYCCLNPLIAIVISKVMQYLQQKDLKKAVIQIQAK